MRRVIVGLPTMIGVRRHWTVNPAGFLLLRYVARAGCAIALRTKQAPEPGFSQLGTTTPRRWIRSRSA